MRSTLIQPRMLDFRSRTGMQPLAMGILAAKTPRGISLTLIDENVESFDPVALATDLVAMSVHTFSARRAYALADILRKRAIKVVLGGVHPTLMPDEAREHADAIVCGEAEEIWPRLVRDAAENNLQSRYECPQETPPPFVAPRRDIYKGKSYFPLVPVQFGRGCCFSCDFCSVHALYGSRIRHRSVDDMVEELRALQGQTLFFVDDNIYAYGAASRELFQRCSRMRIRWVGQISASGVLDKEMVSLLRASGCVALFIGFESLCEESLRAMSKRGDPARDYHRAVEMLQKKGIMVCGSFLFGYDGDTPDAITRALAFATREKLALAHFNPLFVTPGTPLYSRLQAEGRLCDPRWWLSDTFRYGRLAFTPRDIDARAIEGGCFAARKKFNGAASIVRRAFGAKANWLPPRHFAIFMAANLSSRWDIYKKQGARLG
jgi:radical SAM superfamily enzyme YgiQ (UPF0313 family)